MILRTATAPTAATAAIIIVAALPMFRAVPFCSFANGLIISCVKETAPALSRESRLDITTDTSTTNRRAYPPVGIIDFTRFKRTRSSVVSFGMMLRAVTPIDIITKNQIELNTPARRKPFLEIFVVLEASARFAYGGMSISPSRKAAISPIISMIEVVLNPLVVAVET